MILDEQRAILIAFYFYKTLILIILETERSCKRVRKRHFTSLSQFEALTPKKELDEIYHTEYCKDILNYSKSYKTVCPSELNIK